jgi:UDP-2,3-diacylglucosamine hydrolase
MSQEVPLRLPNGPAEHLPSGTPTVTPSRGRRIGILAGGGRLPLTVAESVVAQGGSVHVVAIEGEADADFSPFPHTWVGWGHVGRMVSTLRRQADAMVIAGGVRRPNLWKIRPDLGFILSIPQILAMMTGGDDSVLSRVVKFFEAKGIEVRGAHQVAPELLASEGPAGTLSLYGQVRTDAELGFAVRAALGPLDAGQAVVVADGAVLAIEGAEGTDAMLARVGSLNGTREDGARRGVLAKGPKPGQELRVDMPTIGPRTVEHAAEAGLAGVALEAGATLLLDRSAAVAAADEHGIAIEGLPRHGVHSPVKARPQNVEEGQSGGDTRTPKIGVSPAPSPSPQGEGESRWRHVNAGPLDPPPAEAAISPPRMLGRLQPDERADADIRKALTAIHHLAPFHTGRAVVVSRAYVLAVAAAEPPLAMLERVRALRQWGVGARRRIGVLGARADVGDWDAAKVEALVSRAAAAGLAGIAVTGPAAALAAFEHAGETADRHELFLALTEERS